VRTELSLPYCFLSGIRTNACIHSKCLLAFSFIKDRIDQNVHVLLLIVGEREKGEECLEDT